MKRGIFGVLLIILSAIAIADDYNSNVFILHRRTSVTNLTSNVTKVSQLDNDAGYLSSISGYVNKSGDTMTGDLRINAGLGINMAAVHDVDVSGDMEIVNPGTDNAFRIDQNGNAPASTSTGGAFNLDNSGSTGAGIVVFSSIGSAASGRLLNIRTNNNAFDQSAINIDYYGTNKPMSIWNHGTGSGNTGFIMQNWNEEASVSSFKGSTRIGGIFKITHEKASSDDSNAVGLHTEMLDWDSAAQGIYIDSETTGVGLFTYMQNNATGIRVLSRAVNQSGVKIEMPNTNSTALEINPGSALINGELNVTGTVRYGALEALSPHAFLSDGKQPETEICIEADNGKVVEMYLHWNGAGYEWVFEEESFDCLNKKVLSHVEIITEPVVKTVEKSRDIKNKHTGTLEAELYHENETYQKEVRKIYHYKNVFKRKSIIKK